MSRFEKQNRIAGQHIVVQIASVFAVFAFGAATQFADWSADPALAAFLVFTGLNILVVGLRMIHA